MNICGLAPNALSCEKAPGKLAYLFAVVKQGEDKIEFEKVLGYHQHNRAGLGFIKQTEVPPKQTHDYRKLVSDKVHDLEEEQYFAKAVQLRVQGNWTRWCNYIKNELSWKHLLVTSPPRLTSFVLGATFDTFSVKNPSVKSEEFLSR